MFTFSKNSENTVWGGGVIIEHTDKSASFKLLSHLPQRAPGQPATGQCPFKQNRAIGAVKRAFYPVSPSFAVVLQQPALLVALAAERQTIVMNQVVGRS